MKLRTWHSTSDTLAHLRKPHGILAASILAGIIGWASWTFWVAHHI